MALSRPQIKTFWLVLNYQCNNRCNGCYAHDTEFQGKPMDFNLAVKISEMLKLLGAKDCLLIGGEPTLYRELDSLIKVGSATGIAYKLVTNGRKLKDKDYFQRLVEAGLAHVSISIEGSTSEIHNQITGVNSFRDTMSAISNAVKINISFNTLLTISSQNFFEIVPLTKMLSEMGVKNILFNIGLPSPGLGCQTVEHNDFVVPPQKVADIISDSYRELKTLGIKVKFFATIPLCLFSEELLNKMIEDDFITDGIHCHIYYGTGVVFEPNGNVLPCTHFVKRPLFNIFKEKIETVDDFCRVWYSERGMHGSFQKAIWKYPCQNCKTCKYWGKCIGGCPFLWAMYNPQTVLAGKEVSKCLKRKN